MARRFAAVDEELNTVVLPNVVPEGGAASCVTVTVLFETPVPVIVTVAVLGLAPVFSEFAATVIVPLFEPETGDTFSQLPSSVIFQLVFDVILNVPLAPEL